MPNFVAVKQGMNHPRARIQYLNTMNTTTEQRRPYERPMMTVVEVQNKCQLLTGSPGVLSAPGAYSDGGNPFTF